MAFDLNKLREAKNEVKSSHVRELREYLNTEEFEDKLQDFLMASVTGGESDARIELEASKQDSSSVRLRLLGIGNGFNPEVDKAANFYVDLCEDSEAKIGDLNRYSDIISEKLRELGLDVSLAGASPENFAVDHIAENNMSKRVFVVDLEKLVEKEVDAGVKMDEHQMTEMVKEYNEMQRTLRKDEEYRDECMKMGNADGYTDACRAVNFTQKKLGALKEEFRVLFPNEDLKSLAGDPNYLIADDMIEEDFEPDLGPDY